MSAAVQLPHPITGETINLSDLAKEVGVSESTMSRRWRSGKRGEDLLAAPDVRYQRSAQEARNARQLRLDAERRALYGYCRLVRVRRLADLGKAYRQEVGA